MVLTDLNPAKFLTDQDWPCDIDRPISSPTMLLKTNLISSHVFD
jgi:hypothetical protein